MKKLLLVLGVTAMMLSCVGCGKEVKENVKTTSIYETTTEENRKSEDVIFVVADVYVDAFKEIYGDDFSADKLTYVDDNTISYEGKEISWEYVDELVYNSMTNKF